MQNTKYQKRKRRNADGFTLIELLVTIALVVIVTSVVVVNVANIIRVDLAAEASRVASVMRYLHATAVIQNRPCRLVIDIEGGTYSAECFEPSQANMMFLLDPEKREEGIKVEKEKGKKTESDEDDKTLKKVQPFVPLQTTMMKESTFKLPKGVAFKKVMTIHQEEPAFDRAEIYFFPNGFVEKSYVYIGYKTKEEEEDEDEDSIKTIGIESLSGKVTIYHEEKDYKDIITGR